MKLKSITRLGMEDELIPLLKRLKGGIVLDVGSKDSPYKKLIKYSEYKRLDVVAHSKPDYVADLHDLSKLPSNHFDCVIATEVFEHLYDPGKAAEEIRRVLKKGGVCIMTTRFFYHYHPDPHDYYRFTWDSINYIFRNYSKIEIKHHGNWLHTFWQLIDVGKIGIIPKLFNPLVVKIKSKKTKFPLGFLVYAIK